MRMGGQVFLISERVKKDEPFELFIRMRYNKVSSLAQEVPHLPKPSSIKTAQIVLVLKLALVLFMLVLALLLLVIPDSFSSGWSSYRSKTIDTMFGLAPQEYKAGHFGIVAINLAPSIILIALTLFFIHRRKRMASIILALLALWFSSNNVIQLVLSFAVVVLLFTRSSRSYFAAGADAPGAEVPAEAEREEETEPPAEPESEKETTSEDAEGERSGTKPEAAAAARRKPSADPVVEIREADAGDAEVVHALMMEAFEEYRAAVPPSSALDETVESVRAALESGSESAAILYEDGIPGAMVRFRYDEDAIYFFRLSVLPARRKRGYARQLVQWIEQRGWSKGLAISRCRVRQSVHRNLILYENMGYEIKDQELIVRPGGTVKTLTLEKNLGPY
jgi:GNAT superfamily N-acetyltransferase